jgi:hypothetical protein
MRSPMRLAAGTYRFPVSKAKHRWCPLDFSRYGLGIRIGDSYRGFTVYIDRPYAAYVAKFNKKNRTA